MPGPAAEPERAQRRAWWSQRASTCPAMHICLRQAAVGGKAPVAVRVSSVSRRERQSALSPRTAGAAELARRCFESRVAWSCGGSAPNTRIHLGLLRVSCTL